MCNILDKVIIHVQAIKKIERAKGSLFPNLDKAAHLHKEFMRMWKKESFFEVFWYMEGYADVDKSSDLGRWYMQNLYANLCVRAKWHVNYLEKHPESIGLDNRCKLMDFYATMTTKSEYDNVDKTDFTEVFERAMQEKPKKKFKAKELPDNDEHFVLFAPPPPKAAISILSF